MPTSSFSREFTADTAPAACWSVLTDVPRLVTWISIVDDVKELAPLKRYTAILMDRLGPFKLQAELDIEVSEVDVSRHIRVCAAGEDRQMSSRINVDATMHLEPLAGGGTRVVVAGTYEVVGRVATMGAGTVRKKADAILGEFFEHATKELDGS